MRNLIFLLFLLPTCLFAQNYNGTVDVKGKDAATLYNSAKEWFAVTFNAKIDLPPVEDKDQGKLTGNENSTFLIYSNDIAAKMNMTYALKVNVKDGQYKYEFDNIMVEHGKKYPLATFKNGSTAEGIKELFKTSGMKNISKKMIEVNVDYNIKVINQVDMELNRLIDSLGETMRN
jgi:hypothetical protein